MMIVHCL